MSITMMARLMLNLHEHAERGILTFNDFSANGEVIFMHAQRTAVAPHGNSLFPEVV
ncbi:hypothetical protein C8R44DRAFT_761642 [Mycena epipterygia]|nr:hypothetical protein C8R44DRAFT_761642 [Mycena epipterygia]